MNRKLSGMIIVISAFISLLFLEGCASTPLNVSDAGIKIERIPSEHFDITEVFLYEKHSGFSIEGIVRPDHYISPKPKGHIEIDIVDSEGNVLHKETATMRRFGKASRHPNRYRFSKDILFMPTKGSIIRLTHHEEQQH
jgi:hypothetical protein